MSLTSVASLVQRGGGGHWGQMARQYMWYPQGCVQTVVKNGMCSTQKFENFGSLAETTMYNILLQSDDNYYINSKLCNIHYYKYIRASDGRSKYFNLLSIHLIPLHLHTR